MRNTFIVILSVLFLASCEDVITVDTGFEERQMVVDAWINTRSEPQTIKLTWSQDYFNSARPTGIEDAQVTVASLNGVFPFEHQGAGEYIWTPESGQKIGSVGDQMALFIEYKGDTIASFTKINRVPEIDSIRLNFEEESLGIDEGFYGELYAVDFEGQGDTYWIRAWKNDTLLNRPQELVIVWDATFDFGTELDGTAFIRPLRFAVNPFDDDGMFVPYQSGDKIYAELHSISNEAFFFLQIAQEQMTNGDNGIFSLPIANAQGNIINQSTEKFVLGIFNVAEISSAETFVE